MVRSKAYWLLLLFFSVAFTSRAEESNDKVIADLLQKAAKARDAFDDNGALSWYRAVLAKDSTNLEANFNMGIITQRKGWLLEDVNNDDAKKYYTEARAMAQKLYNMYPNSFEANLSMAGTIGRLTKFGSAKERVQSAWDIKKYADAAYKLRPNDPQLKHLLAWWNFELSKPSWFERSMAQMLFGGLPKGANVNTAISLMLELIKFNPNYVVYGYDLARFYEYAGDKVKAIESLKRVLTLPPHAPEETTYLQSAKRLLNKLQ